MCNLALPWSLGPSSTSLSRAASASPSVSESVHERWLFHLRGQGVQLQYIGIYWSKPWCTEYTVLLVYGVELARVPGVSDVTSQRVSACEGGGSMQGSGFHPTELKKVHGRSPNQKSRSIIFPKVRKSKECSPKATFSNKC